MENAEDWTKEELIKNYVDQMTAVTVQVNISIKGKHTILDATSVEKILRNAEIIALQDCSCRTRWQNVTLLLMCASLLAIMRETRSKKEREEFL